MHILIIEDEEDIRAFVKRALLVHDEATQVTETRNGMEAVRMLAMQKPDAIILDMLMPDMDGWEFLQIMEALELPLPTVILTAVHRDNAALCGIMTTHSNVIAVENKPLGIEEIGEILTQLKNAAGQSA